MVPRSLVATLLIFLCLIELISAQSCPLPTESTLVARLTNVLSQRGGEGQSVDPTILSFNYTCLAQGDSIDQYRSLAVVVVYEESGSVEDLQFQLQCSSFNNVGSWELFGPESTPPAGFRSLNTRTDCSSCPSTANNDHKCAPCHISCPRSCTGTSSSDCCNVFSMQGQCMESCPVPSQVALAANNYVCVLPASLCQLPQDSGPCSARGHRYYYNQLTQSCELFFWGGCRGNDNRFLFQHYCEDECSRCPPSCTPGFCATRRSAVCTVGRSADSTDGMHCGGECIVSNCLACFYHNGSLPPLLPPTCPAPCVAGGDGRLEEECVTEWGQCVKRSFYSNELSDVPVVKTQDDFRCYPYQC